MMCKQENLFTNIIAWMQKLNPHVLKMWNNVISELATFNSKLFEPKTLLEASWIRFILFGCFVYKFLSRDYPSLYLMPEYMFDFYPFWHYSLYGGYVVMGIKWLVDLCTFHWIHWFLPFPGEFLFQVIYYATIIACCLVLFFGRGPKRIFAIMAYILISYLYGYLARIGSDIDAQFIAWQLALIYVFSSHEETVIIYNSKPLLKSSTEAGWFYSMALLIFIGYYFLSGINKLVHISIIPGWFEFDFVGTMHARYQQMLAGSYFYVPAWFQIITDQTWFNYLGPPFIYFSHLMVPVLYFKRDKIALFGFIYLLFHFMTTGICILFAAVMILWFIFLPVYKLLEPVVSVWDSDCTFCYGWIKRMQRLDWLSLNTFIGSNEIASTSNEQVKNWDREKGMQAMCSFGAATKEIFYGYASFRRIAWTLPLLWPFLPLLYFPGAEFFGDKLYAYIAKNRYKFGCRIGLATNAQQSICKE